MDSPQNKKANSSSTSTPVASVTSWRGKSIEEICGPMPPIDLGSPDGLKRLKRLTMRRIAKGLIADGICPNLRRPWDPELADIEALCFPPMKDETHLMDGRTLKEAWPELKAQIMALPDE